MYFDNGLNDNGQCAKDLITHIRHIMRTKNTNLVFSADLSDTAAILRIVGEIGDQLLGVKLHSDTITGFDDDFVKNLRCLAQMHEFIIIEDRKLCDIGSTARAQVVPIAKYADLITVHGLPGCGILDGIRSVCIENSCGVLLIAEMSSQDNLLDVTYTNKIVEMARQNRDIVVGFIAQHRLDGNFLHFAPGINVSEVTNDALGQQYNTPRKIIRDNCVDILIVGRGINDIYKTICDHKQTVSKFIYTQRDSLVETLFEKGIVKTGNFVLKSGQTSTVYADFRMLMASPNLHHKIACELRDLINEFLDMHASSSAKLVLAGVPLGALPLATMVSYVSEIPMVMVRTEPKTYGLKKVIEGYDETTTSQKECIVIEDVLTTGGSVLQTIGLLEANGFKVVHVVAILDREESAVKTLETSGYTVSTLFKLSDLRVDKN